MKIAICFSGQPRFLDVTKSNLLFTVYQYYNNVSKDCSADVFFHAWTSTIRDGSPNVKPEWIKEHMSCFDPKGYEIEDYNFEKHCPDVMKARLLNPSDAWYGGRGPNTVCQYYSIWRCNELKKQYEHEHNIVYDVVLRMRYDAEFRFPVVTIQELRAMYQGCIYLHSSYSSTFVHPLTFFGGSHVMDQVTSAYTKFTEYYNQGVIIFDENVFNTHLVKQKIPRSYKNLHLQPYHECILRRSADASGILTEEDKVKNFNE